MTSARAQYANAIPRRRLVGWVLLLILGSLLALPAHAAPRLATLDWTLAETLVAIGAPPVAAGQVDSYHAWVGEPRLPKQTADLGLRTQPNLERLAALAPDRILISPMFANLSPRLSRIAPVSNMALYQPGDDTWQRLQTLTREVGELAGRDAAAEALINDTQDHLARLRRRLPEEMSPLVIVQFMDERHVRVFGAGGLYQAVLEQLGIDNAWQGDANAWGFALVGFEALARQEGRLVVVEPFPAGVRQRLAESTLWQHQPSVRAGTSLTLPPVWSFGALPSAQRFAEELVTALEETVDAH
ncbi:iron-siderophore ABC transporter substrate-binding protein [Halomonas urumqiensis]|uniref:ABC transporter substrate-binding protein n=1 Tax=Halomonas urumqiensis TaxID=1684789 RepID=A0A2N7UR09_9GAMM|nr:iron-siderophore ABC transporter substrate-binding protein [Halomonas urumqiensis]PMR82873.1 ABC transporter substrate-binding protein [Halomonas urumqiensis]PTB01809.1 iron-siderophore ABC transporter substrate-binding protein [Halomonas urumqiensis]GHE21905.1 ABC transporter substrate-binding protein [Halomonas urumqiensis]